MKKLLSKINPFQNSYEPFMAAILIGVTVLIILIVLEAL